ncbi:hypothetical protein STRMA_1211 [Streptococcus macacae NCTC 11558]|uniref:Uncharacterized protein n=1 Tax=Streptococcus macacae NCTC 11558 TaxID=764298 RepID=G5JWS4_9STRE|nr:hypothetical protein STRMA_1211 [Streptococcus macacae NCTC 11558]
MLVIQLEVKSNFEKAFSPYSFLFIYFYHDRSLSDLFAALYLTFF